MGRRIFRDFDWNDEDGEEIMNPVLDELAVCDKCGQHEPQTWSYEQEGLWSCPCAGCKVDRERFELILQGIISKEHVLQ